MLAYAGNLEVRRLRPEVERQEIVGEALSTGDDRARRTVDPFGRRLDEASAGGGGQPPQVEGELALGAAPGEVARQHAGVVMQSERRDQHELDLAGSGERRARRASQQVDMRMPAADEEKSHGRGAQRWHSPIVRRAALASLRAGGDSAIFALAGG